MAKTITIFSSLCRYDVDSFLAHRFVGPGEAVSIQITLFCDLINQVLHIMFTETKMVTEVIIPYFVEMIFEKRIIEMIIC